MYDNRNRRRYYKKNHDKMGKNNHFWKTGLRKHRKYLLIKVPNHPFANSKGYIFYHRYIYEKYYNCILLPWVILHHVDHNPSNNLIENLKPMFKSEHSKIHYKQGLMLYVASHLKGK